MDAPRYGGLNMNERRGFARLRRPVTVIGSIASRHGQDELARKQQLEGSFKATVGEIYTALGKTLAFRRWPASSPEGLGTWPPTGSRYRCQAGSVVRAGRVVETVRPVGATLKEILHDPPCRVGLTMRWRIEPLAEGCSVRLRVVYRLNHAAVLRARHWDRRLSCHFRKQFTFLARNLVNPGTTRARIGIPGRQNVT
jgi:hypothetical protein